MLNPSASASFSTGKWEIQSKTCTDAITNAEKHLAIICDKMGSINRKEAKIRDRGDSLAQSCIDYATLENPAMQNGLNGFAENASSIQDYRNALIDRVDVKCIATLSDYEKSCKTARAELRRVINARNKELNKAKSVQNLKNKPNNQKLATAQSDLKRAADSASQLTKSMEETIEKFEEKRLSDLRQVLLDYCQFQMTFAAKSLEIWADAYRKLAKVSPVEDMEIFRQTLSPVSVSNKLGLHLTAPGTNQNNGALGPTDTLANRLQDTSMTMPYLAQQQQRQDSTTLQNNSNTTITSATPVNSMRLKTSETMSSSTNHQSQQRSNQRETEHDESEIGEDEESDEDDESEYETETDEEEENSENYRTNSSRPTPPVRSGW